jgi:hypothetical protein
MSTTACTCDDESVQTLVPSQRWPRPSLHKQLEKVLKPAGRALHDSLTVCLDAISVEEKASRLECYVGCRQSAADDRDHRSPAAFQLRGREITHSFLRGAEAS